MIRIETTFRGDVATASCRTDHGSFYEEARTGALAVSEICKRMAKKKELIGAEYRVPEFGISGFIGKKPRRTYEKPEGFDLVGGKMNFGRVGHQ